MSEETYILDTEEENGPLQEVRSDLSDQDREIITKFEALAKECLDKGIPCFLCAKIEGHDDPVAAWNFGTDAAEANKAFVTYFAPLMLHIVSSMTALRISATNPQTGAEVFATGPEIKEDSGG